MLGCTKITVFFTSFPYGYHPRQLLRISRPTSFTSTVLKIMSTASVAIRGIQPIYESVAEQDAARESPSRSELLPGFTSARATDVIDEINAEQSTPSSDEGDSVSSATPYVALFDEQLKPLEEDMRLKLFCTYRPIRQNLRNAVNTGNYFRLSFITKLKCTGTCNVGPAS